MEGNSNNVSTFSVGLRYGVFSGVALIVYGLILYLVDQNTNQALGLVNYVLFILFIVLAQLNFRNQSNGFMSYGQAMGVGFFTTLIGALLSTLFTYIYLTMIDESILKETKREAIRNMEEQGMSDAQIQQSMEFMEFFMKPLGVTISALIMFILIGLVISLITSAITQRKQESF